jgi:hypothetical protein
MSKPINLYISPDMIPSLGTLAMLYPNPTNLYSDLHKDKVSIPQELGYMSCPAVRNKFKKILNYSCGIDAEYEYDFTEGNHFIQNTKGTALPIRKTRDNGMNQGLTLDLNYAQYFFADEPLTINFTPPYFHKPQYLNYGSILPGIFDVGQWFRPFILEMQLWSNKGEVKLKAGEPLFYAELMTERKVNIHRFKVNDEINTIAQACIRHADMFGYGSTLATRYKRFRAAGLREKMLAEIKKNIIEEDFLTL